MIRTAFALMSLLALAAAAGPRGGPAPAAVKFGVCDWTIGKAGDPAAIDVASRIGLDGVQVSLEPAGDSLALLDPAAQRRYLERSEATGVAIASFAIGRLNDIPLKNDPRAAVWLEQAIGIARDMRVPVILVPFFGKGDLRDDRAGVAAVVTALKALAPRAEKAGIVLALESYLDAWANLEILGEVRSPAVRVYYDVANSQEIGLDIFDEIRFLGSRIVEVHAKDTKGLYGRGSIDFPRVKDALDAIGYDGWVVMEGTDQSLGVEGSARFDLEYLRKIFSGGGRLGPV